MSKDKKQKKQDSQGSWTKQKKKRYLQFVGRHVPQFKQRFPRNFFSNMANHISSNKTSKQCSDFHYYRKTGCSSLYQLIEKVAQEINQDPASFIKNHKQIEKRQTDIKYQLKSIQNIKPIKEEAVQEFKKSFNPFEIIFKPGETLANQQKAKNVKQQIFLGWDSVFCRSLQSKLYPMRSESGDVDVDGYNSNQNDKMVDKNQYQSSFHTSKKRLIQQKLQRKGEKMQIQMAQSGQNWTKYQNLKLLVFLQAYKHYFQKEQQKRKIGIFNKMSSFIKTRNQIRCKNYFQSLQRDKNRIDGIINDLQTTNYVSREQIQEQIQSIQEFYTKNIQEQCNALNQVRFLLCLSNNKNLKLIEKYVHEKEKIIKQNILQLKSQTIFENYQIGQIELPIFISVFLFKQKIPATKKRQRKQVEEENNKSLNNSKDNIIRKPLKRQQDYQKLFKDYSENDILEFKMKSEQKLARLSKNEKWTISENVKFFAFLMVNRRFLEIGEHKEKLGIFIKLSSFLQTGKDADQCSDHLKDLRRYKKRDLKTFIDEQAGRFGINEKMIEERKQICRQVRSTKVRIGKATLEVDHLPQVIKIKKANFNEEQVVKLIYEAQPSLSFYLTEQENEHSQEKYFFEDGVDGEEQADRRGQDSQEITTSVSLAVPEEKFLKLRTDIGTDLNPTKSKIIFCNQNQIGIRMRLKHIYEIIVQK